MSKIRIFNKFINDFLSGKNKQSFDCSAYLMNSNYAAIYDNLQYFRTIDEFSKYNKDALSYNSHGKLVGNALVTGNNVKMTYYPVDEQIDETAVDKTTLIFINKTNKTAYEKLFNTGNATYDKKFDNYIKKYGGFFLITRADELLKLSKQCLENHNNYIAIVLADDIEAIGITSPLFGKTADHPFRGVFDGCGRTIHISRVDVSNTAAGMFGYTTKTAKILNLVIKGYDNVIVGTTNTLKNSILVDNSYKITLDTIRNGDGDVAVGTLVGFNNGVIDNVVLSADIHYTSEFVPAMYTTYDKINGTDIVNAAWKDYAISSTNNIINNGFTDYTNFCYPTPLCVNSRGNLIPYVGYFNEGTIAGTKVNDSDGSKKIYKESLGLEKTSANVGNVDGMQQTTNFNDIVELMIKQTTEKGKFGASKWQGRLLSDNIEGDTTRPNHLSFRLGPCDKQAYVVGGLLGVNDGDVSNTYIKTNVDFSACYVGLYGGLAGRGVQGTISSVVVDTKVSASPAMYASSALYNDEVIDLEFIETYYISAMSGINSTTGYINYSYVDQGIHHQTDQYIFNNFNISAKNDTNNKFSILANIASMPDVRLTDNFSTNSTWLVPITSVYINANDETRAVINLNGADKEFSFVNQTSTFQNLYCRLNGSTIDIADDNISVKIDDVTVDLVDDSSYISITLSANVGKQTIDGAERSNVTAMCEYNIPMSGLIKGKVGAITRNIIGVVYDPSNQQWVNTAVAIKQSPVYFMGGMFGEYAYANNQLITASHVNAAYNNFNTTSNFSELNSTCRLCWYYYY